MHAMRLPAWFKNRTRLLAGLRLRLRIGNEPTREKLNGIYSFIGAAGKTAVVAGIAKVH